MFWGEKKNGGGGTIFVTRREIFASLLGWFAGGGGAGGGGGGRGCITVRKTVEQLGRSVDWDWVLAAWLICWVACVHIRDTFWGIVSVFKIFIGYRSKPEQITNCKLYVTVSSLTLLPTSLTSFCTPLPGGSVFCRHKDALHPPC